MQKSLISQKSSKENFKKGGNVMSVSAKERSSNKRSRCEKEVIHLATHTSDMLI